MQGRTGGDATASTHSSREVSVHGQDQKRVAGNDPTLVGHLPPEWASHPANVIEGEPSYHHRIAVVPRRGTSKTSLGRQSKGIRADHDDAKPGSSADLKPMESMLSSAMASNSSQPSSIALEARASVQNTSKKSATVDTPAIRRWEASPAVPGSTETSVSETATLSSPLRHRVDLGASNISAMSAVPRAENVPQEMDSSLSYLVYATNAESMRYVMPRTSIRGAFIDSR